MKYRKPLHLQTKYEVTFVYQKLMTSNDALEEISR